MDDFVHSYDNTLEPQESTKALKVTLQKGGLNLTKFISRTSERLGFRNETKMENTSFINRVCE